VVYPEFGTLFFCNVDRLVPVSFNAFIDCDGRNSGIWKSLFNLVEYSEKCNAVFASGQSNSDVVIMIEHVISRNCSVNSILKILFEALMTEGYSFVFSKVEGASLLADAAVQ
jgi:hypothetical protein